jgi:predicted GNAT family N-acyltransferase
VHLVAFDGDRLVGIASLYREARRGGTGNGWRLRGMATDPEVRGAGFGTALLAACMDQVASEGGDELWCNARVGAAAFYQRAGFEVVSEEFEVPGIGAHVVMSRPLSA